MKNRKEWEGRPFYSFVLLFSGGFGFRLWQGIGSLRFIVLP